MKKFLNVDIYSTKLKDKKTRKFTTRYVKKGNAIRKAAKKVIFCGPSN